MSLFRTVTINNNQNTRFGEVETAIRSSQMNFKPTWGLSTLRYVSTNTGTGALTDEIGGEFRLQSGTSTNSLAQIQTIQRGQYQAGTMGQVGIGIRLPSLPIGTQFVEWGYTDFSQSGFFFGVDSTGYYVGYIKGGVTTKIYQSNWNSDKLNGTGFSGFTLDLSDGLVTQIDFVWYGYGDIDFCFYLFNSTTGDIQRIIAHHLKINGQTSIDDPNQPLSFRLGNGASSTSNLILYVGGHQYSVVTGFSAPQKRKFAELLTNYTTAANTDWQPLISIRKKAAVASKPNSINCFLSSFSVVADGEIEVRITVNGATSNLSFNTPTGLITTETGIESKVTGGTALTVSSDGIPIEYDFVLGGNKSASSIDRITSLPIGFNEVILSIRRISASGTIIIKHANLAWNEEW